MKESRAEALRWLNQAENDLSYAALGISGGFYAQVCFQCQQIAEKALKSIHYGKLKKRIVFGHSIVELAKELDFEKERIIECGILDQYYIPTRYPNGLPGTVPYQVYTHRQAKEAYQTAEKIIKIAKDLLPKGDIQGKANG